MGVGAVWASCELELGRDGLPAGFFHEGGHGGGGQHRELAAFHGLGGIFGGHAQGGVAFAAGV